MRPEKACRVVQKAVDRWLDGDRKDFAKALPALQTLYKKEMRAFPDYRTGDETYGYTDYIYYDMLYISDRWNTAFRLRWLIDGIQNGALLEDKVIM